MGNIQDEHKAKVGYIKANPYDYKGFCKFCLEKGFSAIPYVAFASVAQEYLPENERLPDDAVVQTRTSDCGGCGGGKVL